MTTRTLAYAQAVAALLSQWGIPAEADRVEGDVYVRVRLTHSDTARAWVDLGDPDVAYARIDAEPWRVIHWPASCVDGHPCDDVACLAEQVWEWVICWRARRGSGGAGA